MKGQKILLKLLTLLLTLSLFIPYGVPSFAESTTADLVVNGGFEDGTNGWTVTGTSGGFYTMENMKYGTPSKSGTYFGNFWRKDAYQNTVSQTINNIPNGTYTFSIWNCGWERNSSYVLIKDFGGSEKRVDLTEQANSYAEFKIDDIAITSGKCTIEIHHDGVAGKPLYIDDVSLKLSSQSAPVEQVETAPGLFYDKDGATWDASTGIITFTKSGSIKDFFYRVPTTVNKIIIKSDVTVTGAFKFFGTCTIEGENWDTSVIYGTSERRYSQNNNLNPWQQNAIAMEAPGTLTVKNLKTLNPRGYNISGYAKDSVIQCEKVKMIDDRGGDQNNSDGFVGQDGSYLKDCYIDVGDDAVKLYRSIDLENVTIKMQHNGAPLQLGWNDDDDRTVISNIKNLTVIGTASDESYNRGVISWVNKGKNKGPRTVNITDCKILVPGASLFELNPPQGAANITIKNGNIATGIYGVNKTANSKISINGSSDKSNYYSFDGSLPKPESNEAKPSIYQTKAVKGTPAIDGIQDSIWNNVHSIKTDKIRMGSKLTIGSYQLMWDENNLYALVKVDENSTLDGTNKNIWENDCVEFFIDEDNSKSSSNDENDHHLIVSFENKIQAFDSVGTDGIVTATTKIEGGYLVEAKLPVSKVLKAGDILGFDGQVNSTAGSGKRVSISGWSGEQNLSDKKPSVWGDVTLIESTASNSVYTVMKGDCLWSIARKYKTTAQKIYDLNKQIIKNPSLIYPGQKLVIK